MPNLEEFSAGSGQIEIPDRGAETFAQAGRRAGVAFHQIGETAEKSLGLVQAHLTDLDVSNTTTALATARSNFRDSWTKAAADPRALDHPEIGQAALEQFGQSLDDIASHATTEQGRHIAIRAAATYKSEMHDRVAADMSDLAAARFDQNREQFLGSSAAAVIDDPSSLGKEIGAYQEYLETTHSTADQLIEPAKRAELMQRAAEPGLQRLTMAAYIGAIHGAEDEVAATGKSGPRAAAVQKMIDAKTEWEHLPPEVAAEMQGRLDTAIHTGQERAQAGLNMQQKAVETEGKGVFATLDARVQAQLRPGAQPDPTLMQDIGVFTTRYGSVLPGESSALQSAVTRAAQPEEQRKLVPDGTPTASAWIGALGTDRAPSEAQISQAQYSGAINDHVATVLREGIRIAKDPVNREAVTALKQAQSNAAASIRARYPGDPRVGVVITQMENDSQATFNGWVQTEGPGKAVDIMRNATNPRNFFAHMVPEYVASLEHNDPIAYLKGLPGYAGLSGGGGGSAPSPASGATQAASAAPAAAPAMSAARFKELGRLAGGH